MRATIACMKQLEYTLLKRKTWLCNSFETWRQTLGISNQLGARREIQYLHYNQRKSTFTLS